jgi:hypothetical protein
MKEMSYKNVALTLPQYYHMLLNNQNANKDHFVSPYTKGDHSKDALINKNIEEEVKRRISMEQ